MKSWKVIGQVNGVNASEGEWYYLRFLLKHIKCPASFQYLLSYNGVKYLSFRETA